MISVFFVRVLGWAPLSSFNRKAIRIEFLCDACKLAVLSLAHNDDLVALADDVDNLRNNLGARLRLRECRCVAHSVLNEGRGIYNVAPASIQHLELAIKLGQDSLTNLVKLLQLLLELDGNVLLDVAELGRVQAYLLATVLNKPQYLLTLSIPAQEQSVSPRTF